MKKIKKVKENDILEDVAHSIKMNHHRIKGIQIFIAILLVISFTRILAAYWVHNAYSSLIYSTSYYNDETSYEAFLGFYTIINFFFFMAHFSFIIFFIVWLSRSYNNINRFGLKTRFAPSLAIFSWFIPFVNFILPLHIIKEVFTKNEVLLQFATEKKITGNFDVRPINYWWILLLIVSIFPIFQFLVISSNVYINAINLTGLLDIYTLGIMGDVIFIVANIILFYMLKNFKPIEQKVFENTHVIYEGVKQ